MEEPVELCRSERLASLVLGIALGAWGLVAFRVLSIPALVLGGGLVARGLRGSAHFPLWSRPRTRPAPEPMWREPAPPAPTWHSGAVPTPDVDESSDESFPASDPPSWSPVVGAGKG